MNTRSTRALIIAFLFIIPMAAAAQVPNLNIGLNKSKNMTLSVFAVSDRRSLDSGYGAALTQFGHQVTDLSYVNLGDFQVYQISQLSPKQFGSMSLNFGFTAAFANSNDSFPVESKTLLTGLSVILGKTQTSSGVSLDLRATSLSKDFDPLAWFTDPDILWIGAGLSLGF